MIHLRLPPRDVAIWLAVGLAVREAFSFWTGHPFDFEIWLRNAYYVAHGWNPYTLMPPVPGISFAYTGQTLPSVAYLPLWSILLAGLYNLFALVPGASPLLLYFLTKQPSILGDVLLGALIFVAAMRWGASRPAALRLLAFWMLFPYAILISAIWGQFDGLVAALVLGSLIVASSWKRSAGIGLGILLKSLPIIFVPYLFLRSKGRDRWATLLTVSIPAGFTAAIFAVTGWSLAGLSGALLYEAHGVPQGLTYWTLLGIPAFGNVLAASPIAGIVLTYLWIPGILLGSWWAARRFAATDVAGLVQAFLFLTVLLFLLRWMVNEQYLVGLLPLLLIDVAVWHPERRGLLHATWILGLAFLIWNNFFLVRFGAPVFPGALPFEFALSANPAFIGLRETILDLLAVLFSIHLVQLGLILANPRRTAQPWLVLLVQRAWTGPLHRIRIAAGGREG